jgi:hypothetical protein
MPFSSISVHEKDEVWLDLTEGRSIKLLPDCIVRISDSGSIEIHRGKSSTTLYPPHAWTRMQVVDPYALAALMDAKQVQEETNHVQKIA